MKERERKRKRQYRRFQLHCREFRRWNQIQSKSWIDSFKYRFLKEGFKQSQDTARSKEEQKKSRRKAEAFFFQSISILTVIILLTLFNMRANVCFYFAYVEALVVLYKLLLDFSSFLEPILFKFQHTWWFFFTTAYVPGFNAAHREIWWGHDLRQWNEWLKWRLSFLSKPFILWALMKLGVIW